MKKKVYIETSIVSFLTGNPSSNLLAAAWKALTIEWWEKRRKLFDLFISELVLNCNNTRYVLSPWVTINTGIVI